MSFVRRKRVGRRFYLYELEAYRDSKGKPRTRIVQYLGPEDPVYGILRDRPDFKAPANNGRGRSPEERSLEREAEREQAKLDRELRKRQGRP